MLKTEPQHQRAASAKIKKFVIFHNALNTGIHLQYYFTRGNFHINNLNGFNTAKGICEYATGLKFNHFTNSIARLDFTQFD